MRSHNQQMRAAGRHCKSVDPRERKLCDALVTVTPEEVVARLIGAFREAKGTTTHDQAVADVPVPDAANGAAARCHATCLQEDTATVRDHGVVDTTFPALTTFTVDERESVRQMIRQLRQDCPNLCHSSESLLHAVTAALSEEGNKSKTIV